MGEWQPCKTLTVSKAYFGMIGTRHNPFSDNPLVPDYTGNESDPFVDDKILMWVTPAPVAGIWRGEIETSERPQVCRLALHQSLAKVTGTFRTPGRTDLPGRAQVELWGNHLRFICGKCRFDGQVDGETIQGRLSLTDKDGIREHKWKAKRDKVDLTGIWEWPCATGPRSVRLSIEQGADHLIATYLDRDKPAPVADFYDFGGGFHFTLMIGRKGNSTTISKDTGWLIGEGILDHGALKGSICFHAYDGEPGKMKVWAPRLTKP